MPSIKCCRGQWTAYIVRNGWQKRQSRRSLLYRLLSLSPPAKANPGLFVSVTNRDTTTAVHSKMIVSTYTHRAFVPGVQPMRAQYTLGLEVDTVSLNGL